MNELKRITDFLFACDFDDDNFDNDESYEHYDCAQKLMETYKWDDVFSVWFEYLIDNCDTPEKVINFVNLFAYYGGQDQAIREPMRFIGYLYYMVDMDTYWETAGDLFDGVIITLLENCGLINTVINPYYSPLKDDRVISAIEMWKGNTNV